MITRWSPGGKPVLLTLLLVVGFSLYSIDTEIPELSLLFRLPTGGRVSGRPMEDHDGMFLAASEDRYLYRVDRQGQILSRSDLPGVPQGFNALGVDGTVYISFRSSLAAINPSGGLLWRHHLSAPLAFDPVISADGRIFLVDASGTLTALDHRGELLWKETLNGGPGGQSLIDSRGVLIVPDGSGFLNAWLPWGRFLWRFRLAGRQTAALAAETALYASSDEGTIAKVSLQGTLLWTRRLENFALYLAEFSGGIAALDASGRLSFLSRDGEMLHDAVYAVPRPVGLFSLEDGLLAVGGGGGVKTFSREGELTGSGSIPSRLTTAGLSSTGGLIAGSEDWNIYALASRARDNQVWSGPGAETGNRWNRRFVGAARPVEIWKSEPDYLLLSALMASGGREGREMALDIIQEILNKSSPGDRRYPPYYGNFARDIAGEPFERPILQSGRVVNDYPDLRKEALELLSREAAYASLHTLRTAAAREWFSDNRIVAIQGLGRIGSDPDARSTRTIAGILLAGNTIETKPGLTAVSMEALHRILAYNGSAPDRSLYECAVEVYRRSRDRMSREWALKILRFET
ncbi:hypothetical protein B4O97_18010 [Marispirochaeta aestuarii]|uniref:Pyrrolo-quinoline quinone repeat domain-containing protein n=1 Tax=Marispirochaeta aestuarii TaxID=1963862 RepID=A0A1Y1RTH6_9SPIO|nr:PQQ-binding-like beta-propeller repeat protein [Marispirochaeta aestuarii]ORC30682.1 hypothetical protein B4O97_18010 [Marispirochaeta aestuarii]